MQHQKRLARDDAEVDDVRDVWGDVVRSVVAMCFEDQNVELLQRRAASVTALDDAEILAAQGRRQRVPAAHEKGPVGKRIKEIENVMWKRENQSGRCRGAPINERGMAIIRAQLQIYPEGGERELRTAVQMSLEKHRCLGLLEQLREVHELSRCLRLPSTDNGVQSIEEGFLVMVMDVMGLMMVRRMGMRMRVRIVMTGHFELLSRLGRNRLCSPMFTMNHW